MLSRLFMNEHIPRSCPWRSDDCEYYIMLPSSVLRAQNHFYNWLSGFYLDNPHNINSKFSKLTHHVEIYTASKMHCWGLHLEEKYRQLLSEASQQCSPVSRSPQNLWFIAESTVLTFPLGGKFVLSVSRLKHSPNADPSDSLNYLRW